MGTKKVSKAAQTRANNKAKALKLEETLNDNRNGFLFFSAIFALTGILYAISTFSPVVA